MTKKKLRHRHRKKFLLAEILLLLLGVAVVLSFVPIDLSEKRSYVKASVEERINGEVDMEEVSLYLLPSPRISLEKFTLRDRDEVVISAGTAKIDVALLPLLKKRLVLKKFVLDGAEILVRRRADGTVNLRDIPKGGGFEVSLVSLEIRDSRVSFTDGTVEGEGGEKVHDLSGINAVILPSPDGFTYTAEGRLLPRGDIRVSGQASRAEEVWRGSGTLEAKGLPLKPLAPYTKRKGLNTEVAGTLSLDSAFSHESTGESAWKGIFKGEVTLDDLSVKAPRLFPETISPKHGTAKLDITWQTGKSLTFALKEAKFDMGGFTLEGSFGLKWLWPPTDTLASGQLANGPLPGTLALNFRTTKFPFPSLKGLLPLNIMPKRLTKRILEIESYEGTVSIKELDIAGNIKKVKAEGVRFTAEFEDVRLDYPGFEKTLSGVSGEVELKGRDLHLRGLSGLYGTGTLERFDMKMLGLGTKDSSYSLSLDASADAGEAMEELRKRLALFRKLPPVGLEGMASLRLSNEGKFKKPETAKYSGTLHLKGVSADYDRLPLPLTDLHGELSFDEAGIKLTGLKGNAGASTFEINGKIKGYRGKTPELDLTAEGLLDHTTVATVAAGAAVADLPGEETEPRLPVFDRAAAFKAAVTGPVDSPLVSSQVDLTPAAVTYGKVLEKEWDFPMTVESAVRLKEKDTVIEDGTLKFGGSSLAFKGNMPKGGGRYDMEFSTDEIKIPDLVGISGLFVREAPSKGTLSLRLKIHKGGTPSYDGEVRVSNGLFKLPRLARSVTNMDAVASFAGRRAVVSIDGISIGTTDVSGKLKVPDVATGYVKFDLHADNFDTDDIFPSGKTPPGGEPSPEPYREPSLTGRGEISIKKGRAWGISFGDLVADVKLDKEAVLFPSVALTTHSGKAGGDGVYFRDPKEPLLFTADLLVLNAELGPLIKELGAKEKIASGEVSAGIKLSGSRGAKPLRSGINGEIGLRASKGNLWKFVVLGKVFSIVNIVSITELFDEGMPYKRIKGNFTVKDGVVSTENLTFDSKSIRMSAMGSIDTAAKTIDSTLGIHPFVTIDKLISKIPIVGWIIEGKDKSTVSMYYKIEGPLKDPDVRPMPIRSLSKSLLGIFRDMFDAPPETPGGTDGPATPEPAPEPVMEEELQ
ncbi:MAG: AsmA-like C-terminal domain-containing protein [Thermodesulfobacteriota bacterium]